MKSGQHIEHILQYVNYQDYKSSPSPLCHCFQPSKILQNPNQCHFVTWYSCVSWWESRADCWPAGLEGDCHPVERREHTCSHLYMALWREGCACSRQKLKSRVVLVMNNMPITWGSSRVSPCLEPPWLHLSSVGAFTSLLLCHWTVCVSMHGSSWRINVSRMTWTTLTKQKAMCSETLIKHMWPDPCAAAQAYFL